MSKKFFRFFFVVFIFTIFFSHFVVVFSFCFVFFVVIFFFFSKILIFLFFMSNIFSEKREDFTIANFINTANQIRDVALIFLNCIARSLRRFFVKIHRNLLRKMCEIFVKMIVRKLSFRKKKSSMR